MLKKCSLESLMKWIFMALALSMVSLTIGARLHQSYVSKKNFVEGHGAQVKYSVENKRVFTGESSIISELGMFWRKTEEGERADLTISTANNMYTYKVSRKDIIMYLVEEERFMLLVGMLGLLVAVELAVFLSYILTRPLRRLAWGCKEIAKGSHVVITHNALAPYEFRELTDSFNYMASELEKWKDVQRQLSRMDRLAALGEMLSGLSHEIRNPLASMRIQTDLLRSEMGSIADASSQAEREESLADAAEYINVLGSELDRLNGIVTQLLSFVRPREPMKEAVSLSELLVWANAMFRPQSDKFSIDLVTTESESGVYVTADGEMVRQVVMNLALNAIQAMASSGKEGRRTLVISVGRTGKDDGTAQKGVIIVKDNGNGIPENIQHRIFDPFFTTRKDGTGLGLSIVQRIIEGHGADFSMESSPAGTTFKIFLPLDMALTEGKRSV